MNFEIYTDESGLEVLKDRENHNYMSIGGIWIPSEYRSRFKADILKIKAKHGVLSEMKWKQVSPRYMAFYEDVIRYYFNSSYIRARVIVIEASQVNNIRFNDGDNELGFYKFYYQLIHHWIFDFNSYDVFVDHKVNRDKGRLKKLKQVLSNANLTSNIQNVQAIPSEQSLGIQLADVIAGMVSAKFNQQITGDSKNRLISLVESKECLNRQIAPTGKWEEKLNVFKINLTGGW